MKSRSRITSTFLFVKNHRFFTGEENLCYNLSVNAELAQLVERFPRKEEVASSILAFSTQGIN